MFFSLACEVKKTLIQQEITEQDLLGYWKTLKGNAEQIMFDIDESEYYFRSFADFWIMGPPTLRMRRCGNCHSN